VRGGNAQRKSIKGGKRRAENSKERAETEEKNRE
jgi:hypothetical protein